MNTLCNVIFRTTVAAILLTCFNTAAKSTQEQLSLKHPKISSELVFNIQLPSNYQQNSDKSYIVMFDFHPYANSYLTGMHDWMSHNAEWPWLETIIVTPAYGNKLGMVFDDSGATTPVLDFFASHLMPTIDDKYRTNGFRIISGFRNNGAIVLSALLNKPDLFNAYIAVSPELSNDFVGILSSAKAKLAKLSDKPRFLLLSHGQSIKEQHQLDLYQQLLVDIETSAPATLTFQYENYADKYHMSLPLVALIDGIEHIFDDIHRGIAPDSDIAAGGVQAIVSHYQWLSDVKYGFRVSPHMSLRNLGYHLLAQSFEAGVAVFEDMVSRYPNDAYCYHYLADAYAQKDDFETAVKYQQQAVTLSKDMKTWHQKRHKRFLEEYQKSATLLKK